METVNNAYIWSYLKLIPSSTQFMYFCINLCCLASNSYFCYVHILKPSQRKANDCKLSCLHQNFLSTRPPKGLWRQQLKVE